MDLFLLHLKYRLHHYLYLNSLAYHHHPYLLVYKEQYLCILHLQCYLKYHRHRYRYLNNLEYHHHHYQPYLLPCQECHPHHYLHLSNLAYRLHRYQADSLHYFLFPQHLRCRPRRYPSPNSLAYHHYLRRPNLLHYLECRRCPNPGLCNPAFHHHPYPKVLH